MAIHIHDYGTGATPDGPHWTTAEATALFEFTSFCAPHVFVRRRADGQKGILEFTHSPRVYFNFQPSV